MVTEVMIHKVVLVSMLLHVHILEEVQGVENELMKLKNHVLTQKMHVKELIDGVYLKVLSEETIESIIEDSVFIDPPHPSELEAHIDDVSETLDLLLSENRIDEALVIIEMEDENLKRVQFEGNAPSDVLMSYNSSICEKKAMLTLQLTLMAENPRTAALELQKARLCRLGESHLASQLLLEYYHSRIATGRHNLHRSKSYLHGTYIKELAKFLFSIISQAGRSFVMLYGEASPYASELIWWACEETKMFVICFNKYVKSISKISGGLSKVVESVQFAMSFCSLSETQTLVLQPYLIKHIRPGVEVAQQVHINHYKKVLGIFIATDSWVLGRYLVSGVVNEAYSSIIVGNQPEYCLLTCSGREFVTLLQVCSISF
jgi:16S rRNA G966 N2-methylase RsmD